MLVGWHLCSSFSKSLSQRGKESNRVRSRLASILASVYAVTYITHTYNFTLAYVVSDFVHMCATHLYHSKHMHMYTDFIVAHVVKEFAYIPECYKLLLLTFITEKFKNSVFLYSCLPWGARIL